MWWNTPFQSTLPQGEWRRLSENSECYFLFQSTLPQGEWQDQIYIKYNLPWFQSTLPQGEWLRKSTVFPGLSYFNPHSRKGSDNFFLCGISCHWSISIHTPARGVTQEQLQLVVINSVFQSTLPQGEWRSSGRRQRSHWWISIHTPARGVTITCACADI